MIGVYQVKAKQNKNDDTIQVKFKNQKKNTLSTSVNETKQQITTQVQTKTHHTLSHSHTHKKKKVTNRFVAAQYKQKKIN